jgi:DNA-binding winged helix-turn-helix (wHTH) protein/tetratricopeptide (TPR) repeat protein
LGTDAENGAAARISLAREPDFQLGQLRLSPSTSEVRAPDGAVRRVEPKVMEVLVALTRAAGRTVTRDELVEACWEGRIVSDDAISRTIAKARQLSRDLDPPPFVLDTVPKIGFRLTAGEAVLLPDQKSASSDEVKTGGRLDWRRFRGAIAAGAVAVVALAVWGVGALLSASKTAPPAGNVDVVLLGTSDQDPELKRLSILLTDTAIRYLAQSGIPTQREPLTVDRVAASEAEFRLAGTLDRADQTYIANLQMIDRRSGSVLWATKIEREGGAPAFAEEFGSTAAAVMKCALDERRHAGGLSLDVLSLFLTSCEAALRGTLDVMAPARRLAEAAPQVAGAHAMHALAAAFWMSQVDDPAKIAAFSEEALQAAERSLKLDPETPKAYVALASRLGPFGNWLERERYLNRALEVSPDLAVGLAMATFMHREVGRLQEAADYGNRTLRLADPRASQNIPNVIFLNAMTGRERDLNDVFRMTEVMPQAMADGLRWTVDVWWSDPKTVAADPSRLRRGAGSTKAADCIDTYLHRLVDARGKALRGLPAGCEEFQTDWRIRLLARQGDVDAAYALFDTLPNSRRTTMFFFYPEMKAFRQDPRFMPLMEKIGLLAYWRESDHWPDFCSEPDLPYDCRKWGT